MTNKKGLDSHSFDFLLRVILARVTKVARNSSKIKVVEPKSVSSGIARLELSTQLAAARRANTRPARPKY